MIYRHSNDPVFLKKINIDVWLLRDQLEQIILSRLKADPNIKNFDDLIEEFSLKPKPNLRLLKFDDSEIKVENEDDLSGEFSEKNKTESIHESELDSESIGQQKKEIIIQRLPQLPDEKIHHGKTFLSEIYMDRMLFFSNKQFVEGQSVVIQFNIPQRFILNAEVLYSQAYSLKNRIISKSNMPFRVCVQFTFLKSGERTLLRKFLEDIEFKGHEDITSEEKESETNEDNDSSNTENDPVSSDDSAISNEAEE